MAFKFHYDSEHDVLYIQNADKKVEESIEFSEDIVLDLDNKGRVIGVELFYASELFKPFNKEINKEFLMKLEDAGLEYKDFRNMWFVMLLLKSGSKQISQALPPLRKSEYTSPLIASCE
jgi:uncharacterized protein YuzE